MSHKAQKKVLVAMSGGVDSSVAAFLLKQQGYSVTGVYFLMQERYSAKQIAEARKAADAIGIPLLVEDISKDFQRKVIDYFISEYLNNRTPNPCVICNPQVKFRTLCKVATREGIPCVATGHYARVVQNKGGYFLSKAVDEKKDQSYFLYRLDQKQLGKVIFPLGGQTKEQTKKIAQKERLLQGQKESQDACFFLHNGGLKEFLAKNIKEHIGEIVDTEGRGLGHHQGIEGYTQGQRYGLGLSGGPFYVVEKDARKNRLIVSSQRSHPKLLSNRIEIFKGSWINEEPKLEENFSFKSRYQIKETSGRFVEKRDKGRWIVALDEPQWAIAEGQSLVAYKETKVVGGGIIAKADCF